MNTCVINEGLAYLSMVIAAFSVACSVVALVALHRSRRA